MRIPTARLRVVLALLASGAVLVAARAEGPAATSADSKRLAEAAEDYWHHQLETSIDLRMKYGLRVETLPDATRKEAERQAAYGRSLRDRLQTIAAARLSHEESISLDILRWEADNAIEAARHYGVGIFPVTPYASPLPRVHLVFRTYAFKDPGDLQRYLTLLRTYPAFVRSLQSVVGEQAGRGIRIPQEELDLTVPFLSAFIGAGDASLFHVGGERLAALPADQAAAFARQVDALVARDVNPALQALVASLGPSYRDKAPTAVGMGQYPGGKEAYRFWVRLHTTLDVSPEDVHAIGLAEVERLRGEMKAVRDQIGFKGTQAEFHQFLRTDPRFRPASADAIGDRLRAYARAAEPKIDAFFRRRPRAPYGVRRLDPALEGSQTFGYYDPPTATEPTGYYYFNGSQPGERPLVNAAGLIYHELVPGHHFQICLQSENESLPAFRREHADTAYTEGWAEYASDLAGEMGLYADPYDRYGRLLMEMFLTTRLVVDTGMNDLGWPRSRAVAFMRENLLESDTQIHTESLRYSADIPAQALAYRMGTRKILELRDRARRGLGDRFDIRAFHEAVLAGGSMPMAVLERHVEAYIAEARSSGGDR